LAETLLGWDAARFLAHADRPGPPHFDEQYESAIRRRTSREPMGYIIGHQEFWGLTFELTPDVLIPRPETEFLVESVLELNSAPSPPALLADVCTGSGCVAVSLARELSAARIVATDISSGALDVAGRNATRHGVGDRIQFVCADLLDGIRGPFDVI